MLALALTLAGVLAAPDLVAWVHVPRAGEALARLEASRFRPLLPLFLPAADRQALARDAKAELFAAHDRAGASLALKTTVASQLVQTWRATLRGYGLKPQGKHADGGATAEIFAGDGRSLTLVTAPDHIGVRTGAELFTSLVPASAVPAGADLHARVDVQALYGMLAHAPQGPKWAGLTRRLGLDEVRTLEVTAHLVDARTLTARAELTRPAVQRGLAYVMGPAIAPWWPAEVPEVALSFSRLSVRPARLWELVALVAAFLHPVEFTLVNSQLLSAEAQAGKTLAQALGDEPAVWTIYTLGRRGESDRVAVLEVADGLAAAHIMTAVLGSIGDLLPQPHLERQVSAGRVIVEMAMGPGPVLSDERVVFAFDPKRIVVAPSRPVLDQHFAQSHPPEALGGAKALAHGVHQDGRRGQWLAYAPLAGPWRRLKDTLLAHHIEPKALASALERTTWGLAVKGERWVLEVTSRAAPK